LHLRMTAKQWLLITAVVILIITFVCGLLGAPQVGRPDPLTPTWTPHPTFTPRPRSTATAILMPTLPPEPTPAPTAPPTPIVHVVAEGETLETIAAAHGVRVPALRELNHLPGDAEVRVGQELILPSPE
jgi:LysM repeat protein